MKEMTCGEFDEIVHGFVRMELLDVSVRETALEHAAHCEFCAERLGAATLLAEASETLARDAQDLQSPPRIEAALRAAFRHHHRRASWRRALEWASVGVAAAVLLVFLWTVSGRPRGQSAPAPKKDVLTHLQSSAPLEAKESAGMNYANSTRNEVKAPANTSAAAALKGEAYGASDFVPVPFTGGITADDPGMIVRVQLTRASLVQLGYPLAETPGEDLILADVLVGEDGWPRGVKLVQ